MYSENPAPDAIPGLSADAITAGMRRFEKSFGRRYDLRIHHPEHARGGRLVFIANHFHHFDPIFVLYAVVASGGRAPRQLAKPSLYRLPVIGAAMRRYRTIVTPRPTRGEELDFDAYERLKGEVVDTLAGDGAVSLAYAGRMTAGHALDQAALAGEREAAHSGLFTMIKHLRGVRIVPVAVEIYEKRTPLNLLRAVFALCGLYRLLPAGRRRAADIAFGEPIDVDAYLAGRDPQTARPHTRRHLSDRVVLAIHGLRTALAAVNADDPRRSLSHCF